MPPNIATVSSVDTCVPVPGSPTKSAIGRAYAPVKLTGSVAPPGGYCLSLELTTGTSNDANACVVV